MVVAQSVFMPDETSDLLEDRIKSLPPHPSIVRMVAAFTDRIPQLEDSMAPGEEEAVQEKALKLDGSWPEHQPRLEALSSHEVLTDLRAAGCHWEAEAG